MRQKFWDYMEKPSEPKKAELTTMEQDFALKLEKLDKWPDGKKKSGTTSAKPKTK